MGCSRDIACQLSQSRERKAKSNMWRAALIVFLGVHAATGSLEKTFSECCEVGTNYAANLASCNQEQPIPGVLPEEQSICLSAMAICCHDSYRSQQCEKGLRNAKEGGSCNPTPGYGSEFFKDCCESCKLGIFIGTMGRGCSFQSFKFGQPWDKSYDECCQRIAASTSSPPILLSYNGNIPTPRLDDLCSLLPGELCAHKCVSTPGSYRCECREGFSLMSDGKSCQQVDLPDRCMLNNPCAHECVDTGVAIECFCHPGYQLGEDERSCLDIDECALRIDACDHTFQRCKNEEGSFSCINRDGTISKPDLKTENGYQYQEKSPQEAETGRCPIGYHFNLKTQLCNDIDECKSNASLCGVNSVCQNTIGSFACIRAPVEDCPAGFSFQAVKQECVDIDECAENLDDCNRRNEICYNLHGSFKCEVITPAVQCPIGYAYSSSKGTCEDIDECTTGKHSCPKLCINTIGSFECVGKQRGCPAGFKVSKQGEMKCEDVNECTEGIHACDEDEKCINEIGRYRCEAIVHIPVPEDHSTSCPNGYSFHIDKKICVDIDECINDIHNCSQGSECLNTLGGYMCIAQCNNGFRRDSVSQNCVDIDECQENLDNCNKLTESCVNTNGTFECRKIQHCLRGFQLIEDGSCQDINECLVNSNICDSVTQYCVNTLGSYHCQTKRRYQQTNRSKTCPLGLRMDMKLQICVDINECLEHDAICGRDENCVNMIGSFRCVKREVNTDYPLILTSASTIPQHEYCPAGFRYDIQRKRCFDIDECSELTFVCDGDTKICINEPGGYRCVSRTTITENETSQIESNCPLGYYYSEISKSCDDFDECRDVNDPPCDSNQACINTIGSYHCNCKVGFSLDPLLNACVDINECQVNQHNCLSTQRCDNTIGSFHCIRVTSCGTGYTLNANTGFCEDDDECILGTDNCRFLGPIWQCKNTAGSFRCVRKHCEKNEILTSNGECRSVLCTKGFETGHNGKCIDINECTRSNPCRRNQMCINTPGSYHCVNTRSCGGGFELNEDGTACNDIDECARRTHECLPSQTCINTAGGYICQCPNGYMLEANTSNCIDIDECVRYQGQICSGNSVCENIPGSYRCICKEGFQQDSSGKACADIDECAQQPDICHQNCVNVWGSYRCSCNPGYTLTSDNRTCQDINECHEYSDRKLCIGVCLNVPGSYQCSCPEGYNLGSDGRTCQDIDECLVGNSCHGQNEVCLNIRGGHKCIPINCPPHFVKDTEHKNRCKRASQFCADGDTECLKLPHSYSFNFITFTSNLPIPPSGQLDLFTMRSLWAPTTVQFKLDLIDARAPVGIKKVNREYFKLRRPAVNQAIVSLVQLVQGPQEIDLQLTLEVYHNGIFAQQSVAKLLIIVSNFEF